MQYRYGVIVFAFLTACTYAFAQNATPSALKYSSYFGDPGADGIYDVAVDSEGYVYVVGETNSASFPLKNKTFQPNHRGKNDLYLLKFTPEMESVVWSTFYGGSNTDWYAQMRLFQDSIIYIAGETYSGNLRMVGNSYQNRFGGESDVFIARFNTETGLCTASTFVGGSGNERPFALEIDERGYVYITGVTALASDYPTTPNVYQPDYGGGLTEGFITKLSGDLQSVVFSTFVGRYDNDQVNAIAFDEIGNIYVGGLTNSEDFPTTIGAYQTTHKGTEEAFIAKFDSTCSVLQYCTLLGTPTHEMVEVLRIGTDDNVYVMGRTDSPDFPTTAGVLYPTSIPTPEGLNNDLFFAKLSPDLSQVLVSSFFGGYFTEEIDDFYFLANTSVIFAGGTQGERFPVTPNAFQHDWQGRWDSFITVVSINFDSLIYSSYVGGDHYETLTRMVVNGDDVYLVGGTESSNYPITGNAYQSTYAGNNDGFITKFSLAELLPIERPRNMPVPLHELAVYPNPAVSVASVSFTLPERSEVRIAVYNALGKMVLETNLGTLPSGSHSAILNAKQWEAGTYFCRIYAGKEVISGRFIVQR